MCCQESICNVNISNINSIPSEWKHYGCFHTVSSELFLKTLLASGTWYWSPFRVHSPICHPSFFMSTLLGFHLFNNSTKIFEASYVQQHGSPGNRSAETQNAAQKHSVQRGHKWEARGAVSETGLMLRRQCRADGVVSDREGAGGQGHGFSKSEAREGLLAREDEHNWWARRLELRSETRQGVISSSALLTPREPHGDPGGCVLKKAGDLLRLPSGKFINGVMGGWTLPSLLHLRVTADRVSPENLNEKPGHLSAHVYKHDRTWLCHDHVRDSPTKVQAFLN